MACFALFPRTLLYCSNCGENVGTLRITGLICGRQLGGCVNLSFLLGTRSTQSAWKQCGARHARLNRVTRTVAERFAQSTSEWPKTLPRGFKGPQPLGTPFSSIFRRAAKDGVPEGRKFSRAVRKHVESKNHFQVAHVSGQYPTVACFPFRTIGNLINA